MTIKERIHVETKRTAKVTLTADDWQLFTNSMDCSAAALAINAAIETAVASGADRKATSAAAAAEMARQADHGADDSEPRHVLIDVLDAIFGKTTAAR